MENCCSTSGCAAPESGKTSVKPICAACGAVARPVARQTLLHQLKHARLSSLPDVSFYFCAEPRCDTVYFGEGGEVYQRDDMRQKVGEKSTDSDRTLCYCFDVTESTVLEELARIGHSQSKAFVMEQVKLKQCACEIRNPSGRCCLKDFPKG